MALTRRQIHFRRRLTVFGSLALLLVVAFYLPMTLLAPLHATVPVVVKTSVAASGAAQLSWPSYGGSAIGAVGFDGTLAKSGSTAPLPMASITKVITMLVVLQAKPLKLGDDGPPITMTSADVELYHHYVSIGGKVASVRAGLVFTQHELMQVGLIDSANNYAASLAMWAFGSMDAYVSAAKAWLSAHHLSSVTITEPTGIDPADVATAADLVRVGEIALANPVIANIVNTKSLTVHDVGTISNTNSLLGSDGIEGIKTGTLASGSNLLFASDQKIGGRTLTIVGVVLGAPDHERLNVDVLALLTSVTSGFHQTSVTTKGQVLARYTTGWGQRVDAVAETTRSLVTWSNSAVTSSVTVKPVSTGSTGEEVGSAVFTVGTQTVTVPLELSGPLTDPGPGWRLTHPGLIVSSP